MLKNSLGKIIGEYSPINQSKETEFLDAIYAYRILLGRMPDTYELDNLSQGVGTWREFINTLISSKEFTTHTEFMPPGLEFMSDLNGLKFWFNTSDREMGAKMAMGIYEPEVAKIMKLYLEPDMYCLDIGAQTGFYSLIMAGYVGKSGKVFAFEPLDASFRLLKKNIHENRLEKIVSALNVACSSVTGSISASIVSNMVVADKKGRFQFDCVALDDVISETVHFCKIDVEGHEVQVLEGMKEIIKKHRPILITEMNEYWLSKSGSSIEGYASILIGNGYDLYDIDHGLIQLDSVRSQPLRNVNVLALPREKQKL